MTAPVTREPRSQKIDMSAPVTMESNAGHWRMHFVMPSRFTMTTLPIPNNPGVRLRELPEQQTTAIVFSGCHGMVATLSTAPTCHGGALMNSTERKRRPP